MSRTKVLLHWCHCTRSTRAPVAQDFSPVRQDFSPVRQKLIVAMTVSEYEPTLTSCRAGTRP